MAEDFLEKIYQEASLLCDLKEVVEYTKIYDDLRAVEKSNALFQGLCDLCKRYIIQDKAKGQELWNQVQDFGNITGDLILLGDVLEYKILPLLEESMRQWGDIRTENEEGDYLFETTVSGFLTVKDLQTNLYLHSTDDPMWEARKLAECIYSPLKKSYSLRDCGLGYLAYQLYQVSNGSTKIRIFEKDARMIEYAERYGVLDWIPKESLEIVVDADPVPFLESALEEDTSFHIFAPSFPRESEDTKLALDELDIQFRSVYKHRKDIRINYWNNLKSGSKMISEFDFSKLKREFIIIAGGPSLDDNMEFLRENVGKKTLIAVGTIFRKLIHNGILPDIVVIAESDPIVYGQIEGMEEQKVPMLMLITAYWKIARNYQGEKYLVPVLNVSDELGYPIKESEEPWLTGGTVTSLGMEAAVRFGAEAIYFVGADMGYPGGVSHAEGTLQRHTVNVDGLIPIEGVGGTTVYTDIALMTYREWIEEKIQMTPHIAYYNMSRTGARIKGTIEYYEERMDN